MYNNNKDVIVSTVFINKRAIMLRLHMSAFLKNHEPGENWKNLPKQRL